MTAQSRLITGYAGSKAWFIQYGDAVNRWLLWAQLDAANQLVLSWDKDALTLAAKSVVVQTSHHGRYHAFALAGPGGAGAATVLFDGQPISSAGLNASHTFQVLFSSPANRTYGLYRTTNCLDWSPVSTNVPGTGLPVWAADPNPLTAGALLYRVRMNP